MLYGFNKDKEKIPLYDKQEAYNNFENKYWNIPTKGDGQDSDITFKLGTNKYGKVRGVWMEFTRSADRKISTNGVLYVGPIKRNMSMKIDNYNGNNPRSVVITTNRLIPICVIVNGQIARMVNEPSGAVNYLYVSDEDFYFAVPGFTPSTIVDSVKVYCLVAMDNGVEQQGFNPIMEKYQEVSLNDAGDVIVQRTPYNKDIKIAGTIGEEILDCSLAINEEYVSSYNNIRIKREDEITISFDKFNNSQPFPAIECTLSYLYQNSAAINT